MTQAATLKQNSRGKRDAKIQTALQMQNARLAALQKVALTLTSTLDLNSVLSRVVEMAQTISSSAHSHIFLYDSSRKELTLAASYWSAAQRRVPLHPRSSGITATVARTGCAQFISNTAEHMAYANVPSDVKPGALACLPLIKDEQVLGTLNLGYWEPHPFDIETRNFLNLLAQYAAIAIDNARLHALAIEKARMEHELEMARTVQASLMPRRMPQLRDWGFSALWQPAHIVGGDLYDFVALPDPPLQAFSIADVADKGMPAALFMALTRATLRASITMRCCPSDCIAHANRVLCDDAANGMFVTVCYAQLQPSTGEMTIVNAGHTRPLWYRRARNELVEIEPTDIALGIDAGHSFQEHEIQLLPGDFVLFYTDGITDATNASEQEFGKARLEKLLLAQQYRSANGIVGALEHTLHAFVGGAPQFDDITAVLVKHK